MEQKLGIQDCLDPAQNSSPPASGPPGSLEAQTATQSLSLPRCDQMQLAITW